MMQPTFTNIKSDMNLKQKGYLMIQLTFTNIKSDMNSMQKC